MTDKTTAAWKIIIWRC